MPIFTKAPPLSIYIHIPWCVQKCPYCDFNSHALKETLPEALYTESLLLELERHAPLLASRPIVSIFFGGGTPSLFSGQAIAAILEGIASQFTFSEKIEITLEANPGTVDLVNFADFRLAGVNRLSLGIQSLQDDKLKALGRIHDSANALTAIQAAKSAGFENINLDMMYGLPAQTKADALSDLQQALATQPTHFSWYQLTIEPNTLFYHERPTLPPDESIWEIQQAGLTMLQQAGFAQYEVSAYARQNRQCVHNRNYWEFGDYLGMGAGAHSKITDIHTGTVTRFQQVKHPKDFLNRNRVKTIQYQTIHEHSLIFEFMLNALRLTDGFMPELFTARTGIELASIEPILRAAEKRGLLERNKKRIQPSELGKKFLNDLVAMFL